MVKHDKFKICFYGLSIQVWLWAYLLGENGRHKGLKIYSYGLSV
jgi:hypothetical protein